MIPHFLLARLRLLSLPEYIVDADYTMGSRRSTVVYNGGITLYPHPSTALTHKPVITRRHLSFDQYWNKTNQTWTTSLINAFCIC